MRPDWSPEARAEDARQGRALAAVFGDALLAGALRLRGWAAIQRLYLPAPVRSTGDLDLVQVRPEPIGPTLDALQRALAWLGEARRDCHDGCWKLVYRDRLTLEINTREHFTVEPPVTRPLPGGPPGLQVPTFSAEELLGTKLLGLYERAKGRDLFDLAWAHRELGPDPVRVVAAFRRYRQESGPPVAAGTFRENLARKCADSEFLADPEPLLLPGVAWDPARAREVVEGEYLSRL